MLYAFPDKNSFLSEVKREQDALLAVSEKGKLKIVPVTEQSVRVIYTEREVLCDKEMPGILTGLSFGNWTLEETEEEVTVKLPKLLVRIDRKSALIRYESPEGRALLQETRRSLENFQTYSLYEDGEVRKTTIQTADGVKEVVAEASRIPGKEMYHTYLGLSFGEDEALYGLGQHEEGVGNLRGKKVYVHQANRKIAIPFLLSSYGYGILMNTDSILTFNDNEFGTGFSTEADDCLDYFFLYGEKADGCIAEYRKLTGKAAMLPKWAFGYIQSQERYETADELLNVAGEYRKRGIGLDALVLDWCSWEDGMWGQKSFDRKRFEDPKAMTEELHEKDVHFMISIWPNMDPKCDHYKEMKAAGQMLPVGNIYNALSEEGRKLYWKQVEEGLYQYGIDGWWCDSSEPITPEWNHKDRPDAAVQYAEYLKTAADLLPPGEGNAYALYHAQSLYEGQRSSEYKEYAGKRVVNLTRSAWTGQQRFGTILWSGDVDASWDTLKKQIAAGLHFTASGLPYWTTDIGAFFVKKSTYWYWQGLYNETTNDAGYRELFTRWYQWGAFLPVFRGHGTDCRRELWYLSEEHGNPGDCGNLFYDALLAANRRRYELMPYIYSTAGKTWLEDGSMMRHLVFDYPEDAAARNIFDQYLFGESLMVCPVTEPMYYEAGSEKLCNVSKTRKVYLPAGGWYDFHTGEYLEGGRWITAEAPIEKIPVYVKAGSILPMTKATDRVTVCEDIFYRVYAGKDADYLLYRDAGDGYGYENGEYTCLKLHWDDEKGILSDEAGKEYPVEKVYRK